MPALLASRANTVAAENLAGVLAAESPLALVGAGLSVPAGMPSWPALLDEMEAQLPPLNEEYLRALRDEDDLLWRAEEYRRLIPEHEYQSLLRRRFGASVSMSSRRCLLLSASDHCAAGPTGHSAQWRRRDYSGKLWRIYSRCRGG